MQLGAYINSVMYSGNQASILPTPTHLCLPQQCQH